MIAVDLPCSVSSKHTFIVNFCAAVIKSEVDDLTSDGVMSSGEVVSGIFLSGDPSHIYFVLKYKGDGDPLDVVEIGSAKQKVGSVTRVKPLGTLAMIDGGEVDYKVICINYDDPLCALLNDIDDLEFSVTNGVDSLPEVDESTQFGVALDMH